MGLVSPASDCSTGGDCWKFKFHLLELIFSYKRVPVLSPHTSILSPHTCIFSPHIFILSPICLY